ncbi:hypothetical protein QUB05_02785 [Microcoleus sp. F10-C6]|uniref:hypothetical protein n=1 Tax=unclassified Microcoleus TaxID=2642155 RepID=UPI002FD10BA8
MEPIAIAAIASTLIFKVLEKSDEKLDEALENKIDQLINIVRENFKSKGVEGILIQIERDSTAADKQIFQTILEMQVSQDKIFAKELETLVEQLRFNDQMNQTLLKIIDVSGNAEIADVSQIDNVLESDSESSNQMNDSGAESSKANILAQSFQNIFEKINQFDIKNKVDKIGIDAFIKQCATLAATTGAASGFGGFTTSIVGVPFDLLNNVLQLFRVTLGVIYYKKGVYKVSFLELIKIIGAAIGVEVGNILTRAILLAIAKSILVRMSASLAGKSVPFLGAAIGGLANYQYISGMGESVKRIDMSANTFQAEGLADEKG